MSFVGTNFSELIAECVRVEKTLREAGYQAAYCIHGGNTRKRSSHSMVVIVPGENVGDETLKLVDFIETIDRKYDTLLAISTGSTGLPIYATIAPTKKDKK